MTEIQLHDVALVPERTLGAPADDGPLRGRLTFGWDLLPAGHASAPADWLAHVEATPGRAYRHLLLVCSFRPETQRAPGAFRHASLAVALSTSDPGVRPVARLIDPGVRTRAVAAGPGTGLSFTVSTGIVDVGVERQPEAGPGREEWIVRGHGASQPDPQWEFRRLRRAPLVGDHPVAALVELVPGEVNRADVLVAAELEHRGWGIRRYRARLGPTSHGITLDA
ncbi:hypothetical protein OG554_24050 [Streptomyces griseus]|uniref:hypothetical protein n=1 Tax=Streptomyces griseus TaxID=1911 RepID=UPI003870B96A|nr:hypothetical protein OG554_24050 [Streptomyces fimicarius]